MKREQVIELARKAGIETHERKGQIRFGIDVIGGDDSSEKFERFAALVEQAALERAAFECAAIAGRHGQLAKNDWADEDFLRFVGAKESALECSIAIRALSKEQQ
jgi:hypothetical protein